jgi:chloramphenicol 3-O phosphotransferase
LQDCGFDPDLSHFAEEKKFEQYTRGGEFIRSVELLQDQDGNSIVPLKIGPAGHKIIFGMHRAIAAYAKAGNNLIVDYIQYDPCWRRDLEQALKGIQVYYVKVDAPLSVIEEREKARNTSPVGHARSHYGTVHQGMVYDLEIDSSKMIPEESAALILRTIDPER